MRLAMPCGAVSLRLGGRAGDIWPTYKADARAREGTMADGGFWGCGWRGGAGHDVPSCMDVKRPRSSFHDKKSLPCKGRWRDSAGGVGAGHDVRPCVV